MSAQIRRFGAGLTFDDHDAADLARALLEARITYDELVTRAATNQEAWLRFHTPSTFLDRVMGGRRHTDAPPSAAPLPLRRAVESAVVGGALWLADAHGAASASERLYQTDAVRWLRYHRHRLRFSTPAAEPTIDYTRVRNALPNEGPVKLEREFTSARDVVAEYSDPSKRSQEIEGYEGFAPDDAVFDPATESHEVWSNADFAAEIASIAYSHSPSPRVLDLGCGPAHLFFFLQRYGIADYVGIDGNPMLLRFVPHVKGFEDRFHILDLQQEIRLEAGEKALKFDVVCSFEVLEHIQEDRLGEFLATVRNHMHADSTLLCTASTLPTMDVHVLVRDRDWWVRRFAEAGLEARPDADTLERALGDNPPFNWTEETTNVFALRLAAAS